MSRQERSANAETADETTLTFTYDCLGNRTDASARFLPALSVTGAAAGTADALFV